MFRNPMLFPYYNDVDNTTLSYKLYNEKLPAIITHFTSWNFYLNSAECKICNP